MEFDFFKVCSFASAFFSLELGYINIYIDMFTTYANQLYKRAG